MNRLFITASVFALAILFPATVLRAESTWLRNLDAPDKAEQMRHTWTAYGGQMDIQFNHDLLHDLGIRVNEMPPRGVNWQNIHRRFGISEAGGLGLQVPYGIMESVRDGSLSVNGDLRISRGEKTLRIGPFRLKPVPKQEKSGDFRALQMRDDQGNLLFTLDHIHLTVDTRNQALVMKNMDMHISPWLARQLGLPQVSGWVIGQAHAVTGLHIPAGAKTSLPAGSCAGRPLWEPAANVDVQLTFMTPQFVRNLGNGSIVIAPSASLKNVGSADVPWYRKFTDPSDPYNNDQHPYLIWNMYRVIDNRLEQIGTSGIKHAFLTINSNCTINCGNNHILWPGCEDVYGVGNNDSGSDIGPRKEVAALTGIWPSTCSFFDPGCAGQQTNSSNGTDENRLVVLENKISDNSLDYYFSAWYPNRADVNIFNSMGYRKVNPVPVTATSWNIGTIGNFSNGPVIDTWVAPGTLNSNEASVRIDHPEGHATFAVKVINLGGGLYRYHYAVDNYDVDAQFSEFSFSLNVADSLSDFVFSDADNDDSNNWTLSRSGGLVIITNSTKTQDWGELNSFSFTTSAAPMMAAFGARLAEPTGNQNRLQALMPVPNADLIWRNSLD